MIAAARRETVAYLVAQHASATPDALAILAPGRAPLTFGSLARRIADAVQMLAGCGFGTGSRIALALPNGPETAVAVLAITSCATCVPQNPDNDEATFRFLCERIRVDAVVVPDAGRETIRNAAAELGLSVIALVPDARGPAGTFTLRCERPRARVAASAAGPDDIALVLHTSGTTGKPKPVPLTQRSQYDSSLHRIDLFELTPRDRALCVTPLFTGTAIRRSLFPPLAAGGSVVCPAQFDAERVPDWLCEFQPTFYAANPAIHRAVLDAIDRRGQAPRHALRFIASGSMALPAELQARLEDTFGVPIIQTYSMTETGMIAQSPLSPASRRPGSVGLPGRGQVAILGDHGEFVAAGVDGEIVVRGPQVFEGYEDDPDANRQAFVGGWFRTGDLGYLEPDGYLHVTGRLKEIINRGGFKVPPAEVDAVLMRHPAVQDAATFGVAHPTLGEDVIAAVVLRENPAATPQQVRDFALDALAHFKVPSRILAVASIPKTPLGKVRRRDLVDALGSALRTADPPRDEHEAVVARLFAEVLGIDAIGRLDNFFALGGDSLRGAQVIARTNVLFDCRLHTTTLFRRPTVAEFAAAIRASRAGGDAFALPEIIPLPRRGRTADDDDEQRNA